MLEFLLKIPNVILYIVEIVVALGVLVTVHEFGHFLLAKASGMRVDEFAIGFGRALLSFRRGETLYTLRLIPLGGYNRIFGMEIDDESEVEEDISEEDLKRAFNRQPLYKRSAVILAGSLMNLILAVVLIFILRMAWGVQMHQVAGVNPNGPAYKAGMQVGDTVWSIQDERVGGMDVQRLVQEASETYGGVKIVVDRQGEMVPITLNAMGLRDTDLRFSDLGFTYYKYGQVESVRPKSSAEKLGILPGDYIPVQDGKIIERFVQVDGEYYLAIDIQRFNKEFTLAIPRDAVERIVNSNYTGLGFLYDRNWKVLNVDERSSLTLTSSQANLKGVKKGDIIVSVNGTAIEESTFGKDDPFRAAEGEPLQVTFRRGEQILSRNFGPGEERRLLGITLLPKASNRVYEIDTSGVTFKAGLREGDEIIAIGNEATPNGMAAIKKLTFIFSAVHAESSYRLLADPYRQSDIPREIWELGPLERIIPQELVEKPDEERSIEGEFVEVTFEPYFSHIEPYVTLKVHRGDEIRNIVVDLSSSDNETRVMEHLGFYFAVDFRNVGFFEAWRSGFVETAYWIQNIFYGIKLLFTGGAGISELTGPIGILTISYYFAESGIQSLLHLFVFITVSLAIFNLLPFPALDGGRMVFLILEMIIRRPVVSVKIENIIHIAGFLLLLLFIIYISFFDIARLFKGWSPGA